MSEWWIVDGKEGIVGSYYPLSTIHYPLSPFFTQFLRDFPALTNNPRPANHPIHFELEITVFGPKAP